MADNFTIDPKIESGLVDTGARTVFDTGAQREHIRGKGRCDLLPLDIIADFYDDEFLEYIDGFLETKCPSYLDAALAVFIDFAYDGKAETAFLEVAKHYEDGAIKYAPNNWKKGLPVLSFIDSCVRHYFKYMLEMTDEPHDRAIVWNLLGALWTIKHKPECLEAEY